MKKETKKKETNRSTIIEEVITDYERGFEDGYAVAKRLYKPFIVEVLSEDLIRCKRKIIS